MLSNISKSKRTQQSITDSVTKDIGIGMTQEQLAKQAAQAEALGL